jgi:hypothetical protein
VFQEKLEETTVVTYVKSSHVLAAGSL